MDLFVVWWAVKIWPRHERKLVLKRGRGVLGMQKSRMDFCEPKSVLNSSQGTPEQTFREYFGLVRRMWTKARYTENSSIQPFKLLVLAACGAFATYVPKAQASRIEASEIRRIGDQFEELMLQQMYQQMRSSGEALADHGPDNPFKPSNAEKIFRSMQEQVMMRDLAKRRPLGMGQLVERQLKKQSGIPAAALLK